MNSGTKDGVRNATLPFGGLYMLDDRDVMEIKHGLRGIASISGFLRGSADITYGRSKVMASWTGGNSDAADVLGYQLAAGRDLSVSEGLSAKRAVILGDGIATKLSVGKRGIGARVRMGGTSFTVIGIFKRRGLSIPGQDLDDVVVVPVETARRRLMGDFPLPHSALQQIGIRLEDMVIPPFLADARSGAKQQVQVSGWV